KIKELVPYTQLNVIPHSHPAVMGTAHVRGKSLPVVDMAAAMGRTPLDAEEAASGYIIVTDCQRKEVGFLVSTVDRIIECNWRDIEAPPVSLGRNAFVAGVAKLDNSLVQLVDVEQIFARLYRTEETATDLDVNDNSRLQALNILVVDDSSVARKQLSDALNRFSIPYQITANGQEALDIMTAAAEAGNAIDILVSDIEMP